MEEPLTTMETKQQNPAPILEAAWSKFAQFDAASVKRGNAYARLRRWIAAFGVLATLFAILTASYPAHFPAVGGLALKVLLVASPIAASVLAAYANKFFASGDWLIARAGAEEILKEIYMYRTILKHDPNRRAWLEDRLGEIQRSVYNGMNGELAMETYKGALPPAPRFDPKYPNSDPGFEDLDGDGYFNYRLQNELNWHIKKVNQKQKERARLQMLILSAGAAGAILAALGGGFTIWVALTASLTAAFLGWQELKNLDAVVRNYSKVALELGIIADHWKNLQGKERTRSEFYHMVNSTEEILWSRNVEYIKAMQQALKEASLDEEANLINRVIQEQREADYRLKKSREDAVVGQAGGMLNETAEKFGEKFEQSLGALAEEASSDIVQAELASMREAVKNRAEDLADKTDLSSSLEEVAREYDGVEISGHTPTSVLNEVIAHFPRTKEVKG